MQHHLDHFGVARLEGLERGVFRIDGWRRTWGQVDGVFERLGGGMGLDIYYRDFRHCVIREKSTRRVRVNP